MHKNSLFATKMVRLILHDEVFSHADTAVLIAGCLLAGEGESKNSAEGLYSSRDDVRQVLGSSCLLGPTTLRKL